MTTLTRLHKFEGKMKTKTKSTYLFEIKIDKMYVRKWSGIRIFLNYLFRIKLYVCFVRGIQTSKVRLIICRDTF